MTLITTEKVICPYCSEAIELVVDCSMPLQEYIEDCDVCCQPILVNVETAEDGLPEIELHRENE